MIGNPYPRSILKLNGRAGRTQPINSERKFLLTMVNNARTRRTKDDISAMREALREIAEANRPLTVRHLFYLAVAAGLIDKTEDDYKGTIIRLVGVMREEWLQQERYGKEPKGEVIPFGTDWIVDAGRWIRKPNSYDGAEAALRETAELYRRDFWRNGMVNIMIFCEKDAIADLVYQETSQWDVPLSVIGGDASKTFLWDISAAIDVLKKETHLYFLGDHDEKGDEIIASVVERSGAIRSFRRSASTTASSPSRQRKSGRCAFPYGPVKRCVKARPSLASSRVAASRSMRFRRMNCAPSSARRLSNTSISARSKYCKKPRTVNAKSWS
jgi:hypothetical protein